MLYEFGQMKTTELYHVNLNFVVYTHQDFLLVRLRSPILEFKNKVIGHIDEGEIFIQIWNWCLHKQNYGKVKFTYVS